MPHSSTPEQTLRIIRIIWFALLTGPIVFVIAVMVILRSEQLSEPSAGSEILGYIALAMFVFLTPLGYFIRNQIYKANWQGDVVAPMGYLTGNITFLAMLEGVSMISVGATLVRGLFGPEIIPFALATCIQLINFPTGKPMRPHPDPFRTTMPDNNAR